MIGVSTEQETDVVRAKKSELRLTCDLLMKQVYNVKTAANNPDGPHLEVRTAFGILRSGWGITLAVIRIIIFRMCLRRFGTLILKLYPWALCTS